MASVDYGYGDAAPDEPNKYGYGDAAPSENQYGYGDASPDQDPYGYGDAAPDDAPPPAGGGRNRYRRRGSVTKYSIETPEEVQKEYDQHNSVIERFRNGGNAPTLESADDKYGYETYSTTLKDSSNDHTADLSADEDTDDDDDDDYKKYQATSATDLYLQQQLGDDDNDDPVRRSNDPHKPSRVKKIFKGMRRRLSIDY